MTEALFMVIAAIVAYIYNGDDFTAIIESAIITVIAGFGGVLLGGSNTKHIGTREGYLVVELVWIVKLNGAAACGSEVLTVMLSRSLGIILAS